MRETRRGGFSLLDDVGAVDSLENIGLEGETLKIPARFGDALAGKEQVCTMLLVVEVMGSQLVE